MIYLGGGKYLDHFGSCGIYDLDFYWYFTTGVD